jgi:hypothetical protein
MAPAVVDGDPPVRLVAADLVAAGASPLAVERLL